MPFQDSTDRPSGALRRVCLGKITGAHGIKGLVKVLPYGEDPLLLETLGPLFTGKTGADTLSLSLKNPQGKHMLAAIEGVQDRNAAEDLRGTELYVARESLPKIEDDESYYYEDLTGLAVRSEDGESLGRIKAVLNFGAGDLLEIAPPFGEAFLLPFTDENVPDVNIEEGFVVIVPMEDFEDAQTE